MNKSEKRLLITRLNDIIIWLGHEKIWMGYGEDEDCLDTVKRISSLADELKKISDKLYQNETKEEF